MVSNTNTGNGDELMSLEAEITELQRENARVESQMLRLKSDINAMESQLNQGERVRKIRLVEVGSNNNILLSFTKPIIDVKKEILIFCVYTVWENSRITSSMSKLKKNVQCTYIYYLNIAVLKITFGP